MELRYQLTADEYLQATMAYWRRATRFNRILLQQVLASFLVFFDLLVLAIPTIQDKALAWWGLACGVFLFVDLYVLVPYKSRRLFQRSPNINAEHQMTIDEEGIRTVLPNAVEQVRWSALQKVYETRQMFLVMYSPMQFYIVPKRAFNAAQLEHFRELIHAKGLTA